MPMENGAGKAASRSLLPHGFLDQTNAQLSLTDTRTSPESLPASHGAGEPHADKISLTPCRTASLHNLGARCSRALISAEFRIILHRFPSASLAMLDPSSCSLEHLALKPKEMRRSRGEGDAEQGTEKPLTCQPAGKRTCCIKL